MKGRSTEQMTMPTTSVVALGGSTLRAEEDEDRARWFGRLRQMVLSLEGEGRRLGLVVGGGAPAREGIGLASTVLSNRAALDTVGIAATRLNATVLQQVLLDVGIDVAPSIPTSTDEAAALLDEHHVVVMGGTVPGHTTDAVAVELARKAGAPTCIIATNVDRVYSADPRTDPEATAFTEMDIDALADITGIDTPLAPGASTVVDPVAVGHAKRGLVDLAVLDGRDPDRLEAALEGRPFEGTLVKSR